MEEVWKDITITTLQQESLNTHPDHHHLHPASSPSFSGMILEDYFARPLNRPAAAEELPLLPSPSTPLSQLSLSLNSGLEFQYLGPHAESHCNCSKKRSPENPSIGTDRHYRRLIKNRESAARSRARKQAYTNELEVELSNLREENAKLKKQYKELRVALRDAELPKRNTLQRSSTAPF